MKAFEMRDLSIDELEARLGEESENLMNLRLKLKARTLDNPLNFRQARRVVSRMKTVLHEKKQAAIAAEQAKE